MPVLHVLKSMIVKYVLSRASDRFPPDLNDLNDYSV